MALGIKNNIRNISYFIVSLFVFISCEEEILGDLIITNTNIVNVASGEIDYEMDIIIDGNKIESIAPHNKNLNYKADKIVDGSDKYVIPGLWDMHAHLSMMGEASIPLFVTNGVTGVRDMGGNWSELKNWRARGNTINQDSCPKIKTAGPILESPQFYAILTQILGPTYTQDRIAIDTEERAQKVVDSLAALGVDLIKVRTVKSPEIFKAIATACKGNAIPFSGHIDENIGIDLAVENGIASIEHDVFLQSLQMDEGARQKTLESIHDANVFFTPTLLATYNNRLRAKEDLLELTNDTLAKASEHREQISPRLLENWKIQLAIQALERPMKWDSLIVPLRSFAKLITANSKVLAGTDSGVMGIIPGKGLHDELRLLVSELRLSNLQALQAATINATTSLGLQNEYGLVKSGFTADLLLLNKNPLADISNTSDIFSIIKNGNVLDQREIKKRFKTLADTLKQVKKDYKPETLNHLNEVLNQIKSASN